MTESFDLLFRGLEITTGGQRIHDYREQIAKMERFTSRLLMLENVRYASLFPRDINRVAP